MRPPIPTTVKQVSLICAETDDGSCRQRQALFRYLFHRPTTPGLPSMGVGSPCSTRPKRVRKGATVSGRDRSSLLPTVQPSHRESERQVQTTTHPSSCARQFRVRFKQVSPICAET